MYIRITYTKMDLFDNNVFCKECNIQMSKGESVKNGFVLRTLSCEDCGQKSYHPGDLVEYKQFNDLRNKNYRVKLRIVGNSHAVSIPKDILDFFNTTDEATERMVTIALEEFNKISLLFNDIDFLEEKDLIKGKNGLKRRIRW